MSPIQQLVEKHLPGPEMSPPEGTGFPPTGLHSLVIAVDTHANLKPNFLLSEVCPGLEQGVR